MRSDNTATPSQWQSSSSLSPVQGQNASSSPSDLQPSRRSLATTGQTAAPSDSPVTSPISWTTPTTASRFTSDASANTTSSQSSSSRTALNRLRTNPTTFANFGSSSASAASGLPSGRQDTASLSSSTPTQSTLSSFEKISVAQLTILLDAGTDRKGLVKWDQKVEQITKLIDSSGREVFAVFIRKAIQLNWPAIFTKEPTVPPHPTYSLLEEKVQALKTDWSKSYAIVDAIDVAKEDVFRSFEVEPFVHHFFPDTPSRLLFAFAFTTSAQPVLVEQASRYLERLVGLALDQIRLAGFQFVDSNPAVTGLLLSLLAQYSHLTGEVKTDILSLLESDLLAAGELSDPEVMSALQSWRIPDTDTSVIDAFRKSGPRSASSRQSIDDVLQSLHCDELTPSEVANSILYMLFGQPTQHFNLQEYVHALRTSSKCRNLDWNQVVLAFDIPGLRIHQDVFLSLYKALHPAVDSDSSFDLQNLWAGRWQNNMTQISFLRSFLEQREHLDLPHSQPALRIQDFEKLGTAIQTTISQESDSHWNNMSAMKAILDVVLESHAISAAEDSSLLLTSLVRTWLLGFLLSVANLGTPIDKLNANQENFLQNCFRVFLEGSRPDTDAALRGLFEQSQQLVFNLCMLEFQSDPRRLELIYDRAREYDWLPFFLTFHGNPMAIDMACLRQKDESAFDLDAWFSVHGDRLSQEQRARYGETLAKYLRIKADDEYRAQKEQTDRDSVPLTLHAVHVILTKMQEYCQNKDTLKDAETTCLMTYPRLMNYGCGFDHILERSSAEKGNKLSADTDSRMSQLFGQMYRGELSLKDMIGELRRYKTSTNPDLQDLFCCIVHGLYDEYGCYGEYPEEALQRTALLFGNIIKFRILPPIPEDYGLSLIIESLREFMPGTPMYSFGVEVLLQMGDRLLEETDFCASLLQIPTLQDEEVLRQAGQAVANASAKQASNAITNGTDSLDYTGGLGEDSRDASYPPFQSIRADPPPAAGNFKDPDSRTQERILFVINNLSKENLDGKLVEIKDLLLEEHYQWFAAYLVEQRARLEPNNQSMYYDFASKLDAPLLMNEIVRETYVSVVRALNSKTTNESAAERTHLKSLGTWLGILTLAQDKPIKHRNIYFVDLLIEGYELQRLVTVIAFTCRVLTQGANSAVFRPPNPWLMEILGVLIELYKSAELKLNQKFEIEVLCKDLGLDHKTVEQASIISNYRSQQDDGFTNTSPGPYGDVDDFPEMAMRSNRLREPFSVEEIMRSLQPLPDVLRYPPASGDLQDQHAIKEIITIAVERAIQEIISPVVERSITIASLSTSQLVSKDYANEPSAENYANAAIEMVKSLAGQLALVTCREPLRMSMTTNLRQLIQDRGAAFFAEGTIVMTVNDNLDVAASLIKKAAEDRSVPEMKQVIEADLDYRRKYSESIENNNNNNNNDGRPFGQELSRWATWIPPPYKMDVHGLNPAQRAVYEDFEPRVHGMNLGQTPNMSTDSTGRNLPDVLNEGVGLSGVANARSQVMLPHQSPGMQHESRAGSAISHPRLNGIADTMPPSHRITMWLEDILNTARSSAFARLRDLDNTEDSSILIDMRQILMLMTSTSVHIADQIIRQTAEKITAIILGQPSIGTLEAECLAFLLSKICTMLDSVAREVVRWISAHEETLLTNSRIALAFLQYDLMEYARVDQVIASALREHNSLGLQLAKDLLEGSVFGNEPVAMRSDFIQSITEIAAWRSAQPGLPILDQLAADLQAHGIPEHVKKAVDDGLQAKEHEMEYVFKEWCTLYESASFDSPSLAAFLRDMTRNQLINSEEDLVLFFRLSIETAIASFERDNNDQFARQNLAAAFQDIDALAMLIMLMVKYQGQDAGAVKMDKVAALRQMLFLLVLIYNDHQVIRGILFSQRVFARLFSSLLHQYADSQLELTADHKAFMLVFASTLQALQPRIFPSFAFGWTDLIRHRVLVSGLLKDGDKDCARAYRELVGSMIQYPGALMDIPRLAPHAEALARGTWRNVFVLYREYPEFLCENAAYFCTRISVREPQLRNIIASAQPRQIAVPDPMVNGLKIERLEDLKQAPPIADDVFVPFEAAGLQAGLIKASKKTTEIDAFVKQVAEICSGEAEQTFLSPAKDAAILTSLVVTIAKQATSVTNYKFDAGSNPIQILNKLFGHLPPRQQYLLLEAVVDQLRYPNSHTHFYCKYCLQLWMEVSDNQTYLREMMLRLIRERIDVLRPTPWGVIVLFKELSDNSSYGFWDAEPFAKEPELRQRLMSAARGH